MKITKYKITKKISELDIVSISKKTGFLKRKDGKINGEMYVVSFFMMLLNGGTTLYNWTLQLCRLVDKLTFTEQGLERKLSFRHEAFAKSLLVNILQSQLMEESSKTKLFVGKDGLNLKYFNRILLQDSTCVSVPKNLSDFFPSSFVKRGVSATARVQLTMDLLSDSYEDISLGSFRDNDGKASKNILAIVKENDLILRDKGYWSLDVFKMFNQKKCYFISRLIPIAIGNGVNLYNKEIDERLNLRQALQKAKKNNFSFIDKQIIIGAKQRLNVRLVAIQLPQEVANERRRKARKDRHSKTNHSDEFYERLDWCIFITNIPSEILLAEQVSKIYRLRWRIEIIFNPDSYRDWKSKFNFDRMFKKKSMKPSRAIITFYLLLSWLTLFFANLYNYFLVKVFNKTKRFISIFIPIAIVDCRIS